MRGYRDVGIRGLGYKDPEPLDKKLFNIRDIEGFVVFVIQSLTNCL